MANYFIENKHIIYIAPGEIPIINGADEVEVPHQHPRLIRISVQVVNPGNKLIAQLTLTWTVHIDQKPYAIVMQFTSVHNNEQWFLVNVYGPCQQLLPKYGSYEGDESKPPEHTP